MGRPNIFEIKILIFKQNLRKLRERDSTAQLEMEYDKLNSNK